MQEGIPGGLTVSVAIQAHPSRTNYAEDLAAKLNAPIAWSEQPGDVWDTHRRARLLCDPAADWNLVVQDDAILGRDFMARLLVTLRRPEPVVSLFFRLKGSRELRNAAHRGRQRGGFAWSTLLSAVSVAVRSELVPDMLATGEADDIRRDRDDEHISQWAQKHGYRVWYPLPSLVSHRTNIPSIVYGGISRPHRVSTWFR